MTNSRTIKRALLTSVIALVVCFSMLVGTTFAWFTDSVTSSGNIIQSGTLDVAMSWADGDEDPNSVTWKNAEDGAIFKNTKWEPGYVEARHILIKNEGTLAFKYKLLITCDLGEVFNHVLTNQRGHSCDIGASHRGTRLTVIALTGNRRVDLTAVRGDLGLDTKVGSRSP